MAFLQDFFPGWTLSEIVSISEQAFNAAMTFIAVCFVGRLHD